MIPSTFSNPAPTVLAGAWSEQVPVGSHDGIWIRATGTTAGASTDAIVGNVRLNANASYVKGDIHSISFPLLRAINLRTGGDLETINAPGGGGAFAYSAFLPASMFGLPSSLLVTKDDILKVHFDPMTAAVLTLNIELACIPYSPRPMNYILSLSEDRITALGGLQPTSLKASNLLGIALGVATVTDPASIVLESRRRSWAFVPATARRWSSYLWDLDSAADTLALLPLASADIGEAIGDDYTIKTSGGSGVLTYCLIQATMVPGASGVSRALANNRVSVGYVDAGVNAPSQGMAAVPTLSAAGLARAGDIGA